MTTTRSPSPPSTVPPERPGVSDEIFHLSPFLPLDHQTITPIYHCGSSPAILAHVHRRPDSGSHSSRRSPNRQPASHDDCPQIFEDSGDEDEDEDKGKDEPHDEAPGKCHVVPCPRNSREAYLLLEAARADRRILCARKTLASQIIRRNILVLQYNRLVLEKAQDDLRAADRFVGHVRLMIRKSGQTPASEYAMQETNFLFASEQPSFHSAIDVDLT